MNEINQLELSQEIQLGTPSKIKQSLKFILPIVLIAITAMIVMYFIGNQPKPKKKRANLTPPLSVSVYDVVSQPFQVSVTSFGTVSPRTQSFLISSVNGEITNISNKLREGSFFKKGDVLLKIDDRDYQADVQISQADLADAQQALAEETALSEQAALDWKNLGNTSKPNDLVLRKPQQEAAKARLSSAQASLTKAKLTLERTQIIAPYDGRVLEKLVDLGQVTSANTQIAEIYATDYFEVRLPIRTSDLKFVELPETFNDGKTRQTEAKVDVFSSLTGSPTPWNAHLVRTESAIDNAARQLHVVVQIDNPFGSDISKRSPLKIGEYVTAKIEGKVIENAITIPTESIYQNSYVYVISDGIITRRNIEIIWQDEAQSLIKSGLEPGDRLVVTSLGQVASGTRAKVIGDEETKTDKIGENKKTNSNQQITNKSAGATS